MRLIFAGTPELAATVLSALANSHEIALVITRKDAAAGRKARMTESAVAVTARELGLPVLKANLLEAGELAQITQVQADLGIVVAYGTILPSEALRHLDWWNVHYSLLPSWRGATPAQHAILSGLGGGITIFQLEAGLDSGPIVAQLAMPSLAGENATQYLSRLTESAIPLLLDALRDPPTPYPQSGAVTLAPKISHESARLIFSSMTADAMERKILALNPEPGAWCLANGERLKVLQARALGDTNWAALEDRSRFEGELSADDGRILVFCKGGTLLELLEVQPSGRRRMSAADWFRGTRNLGQLD